MLAKDAFRAALPVEQQATIDDDLGAALAGALATARAAWPAFAVTDASFARFLAVRVGDAADARTALAGLPIADLYLACACAEGEAAAHAAFDGYLNEVELAAAAVRAPADTVDEVKQLLRAQLLLPRDGRPPAIGGYGGRGSLRGWLRITATRELVRQVKKMLRDVPLEQAILDEPGQQDPVLERLKARYRAEFAQALAQAIAELDPRDRTLFRMQVSDKLGIDEIGAIYNVHRATAARWLVKARGALVEATQRHLASRLRLDEDEVTSVIRMIQSRLDVSVERLLDEAGE